MTAPLSDDEIERLRGLIGTTTRDQMLHLSGFVAGLFGVTASPAVCEQIGSRMIDVMGMSYHKEALFRLSAHADKLGDVSMNLGPFVTRLAQIAMESPSEDSIQRDVQREIGALKAEMGQAIEAINTSMATVQKVIDDLRAEHELLSVARQFEADPEFGAFA